MISIHTRAFAAALALTTACAVVAAPEPDMETMQLAAELGVKLPKPPPIGAQAAPLAISKWVKNGPVAVPDGKDAASAKVTVVEFWATWCPPCVASIPHLSKLQKKYKDTVMFVGISGEKADVVEPFVKKKGDDMDYAVAVDDDGKTAAGYMEKFGAQGIPTAFIVDRAGKVVWTGHPMGELEKQLDIVLAGKSDTAEQIRERVSDALMDGLGMKYVELIKAKDANAAKAGAALLKISTDTKSAANLSRLAVITLKAPAPGQTRDTDLADRASAKAVELEPDNPAVLAVRAMTLSDMGNKPEAIRVQRKALELAKDDKYSEMRDEMEAALKDYEGGKAKPDAAKPASATAADEATTAK